MRLVVSSIAWEQEDDSIAARHLQSLGCSAVEIVPGRLVASQPQEQDLYAMAVRNKWAKYGITLPAMQALLFENPHLKLFESESNRQELLRFLSAIFEIGSRGGVLRYVFGSPKNRTKGHLAGAEAFEIAVLFFRAAAQEVRRWGGVLCIEANPTQYGCDFLTSTEEVVAFCDAVADVGLCVHLDTGGMILAGEDPAAVIERFGANARHFHLSAPYLEPIYSHFSKKDVKSILSALRRVNYGGLVSIEMKKSSQGNLAEHLASALALI